jgi:hypothetical protein
MTDHPDWNYWTLEWISDSKYRDVATYLLSDSDIRSDRYDLDVEKWCNTKHFFWTAQEAALISFFRDPDLVERTEEDFIFHDEVYGLRPDADEDAKKNIELRQYITDLYELILDAQEQKELPGRLLRDVYIEWAALVGVDIPQPVLQALKAVEREGQHETRPDDLRDGVVSVDADQSKKQKGIQKYENNLLKIILALLIKSNLIEKSTGAMSNTLAEILRTKAHDQGDEDLNLGDETIKKRLDDAHELLK